MRKLFVITIFFIFLFSLSVNANEISAQSAVLLDAHSGRILFEKNSKQQLPMASTTKIMTGLLACESGKMDKYVKVSPFASGTEGSSLWLKPGEKLKLHDLTYGLMLKSGNDAAVAISEFLAGNSEAFALMMTQRAKEIGATNTSFKNPHGLDDENHYTTAYDLALITREAMKNKLFAKIVSTKTYTIPNPNENWDRALKNHNKLLWRFDGCIGVKTGYTKRCGRCLVSYAERNGEELICVTLNAPDDWNDHTYLLNYGFENYNCKNIAQKNDVAYELLYDRENNRKVKLLYSENYKIAIKDNDKITTEIQTDVLKIPSEKGTAAGKIIVYCNDSKISEIPLITASDVKKITFIHKIKKLLLLLLKKITSIFLF